MPNNAIFGYYMRPQFRTLVTPPWVRTALERYFGHIESQLTNLVLDNPRIYRGGPLLHAIRSANKMALDDFLMQERDNFAERCPDEATAWDQIIVQFPSHHYRFETVGTETFRTPVRLAHVNLADDLRAVSNCVNARYYDQNGSLHFTFMLVDIEILMLSSQPVSTEEMIQILWRLCDRQRAS